MFSPDRFSLMRDSYPRKVSSTVQWQPCSIPQYDRISWANAFAFDSTGRLLMSRQTSPAVLPLRDLLPGNWTT
ncbi:hypothetical protein VT85_13115 [Planctomyces sp. SH-PL62]|nr:hypothetical protein VT85_13115 [Planctomyces sp. SH-PL62]